MKFNLPSGLVQWILDGNFDRKITLTKDADNMVRVTAEQEKQHAAAVREFDRLDVTRKVRSMHHSAITDWDWPDDSKKFSEQYIAGNQADQLAKFVKEVKNHIK